MLDIVSTLFQTEIKLRLAGHKAPALVLLKANGTRESYSWKEYIHEKSMRIALALKELEFVRPENKKNAGEKDFIAVLPLNLPESFFMFLGIMLAGGVPVPIHIPLLKDPERLKAILDDCQPRAVLGNAAFAKQFQMLSITSLLKSLTTLGKEIFEKQGHDIYTTKNPGDLLIMPYTSGTSGKPKGVMLSHENVLDRTGAIVEELKVGLNDRVLSYLPLAHISELVATFFGQMLGGYTVYFTEHSKDREQLKTNFTKVLKTVKPTVFLAVPAIWENMRAGVEAKVKNSPARFLPRFMLKRKIRKELGLDQTKHFLSAGAVIHKRELEFFNSLGMPIKDIYGQTETCGPLLMNGFELGNTITLLDSSFPHQKIQEIKVKGRGVMLGYYKNPEANQKVFDEKGFYRTGDLGERETYDWRPGPHKPKIAFRARKGIGFKLANGEYITEEIVEKLQEEIKTAIGSLDPQIEVIVCGEGKQHLVALIFVDEKLAKGKSEELKKTIMNRVKSVGKSMTKIKGVAILSKQKYLLLTPTMKPRREEIIKNLGEIIEKI